MRSFIISSVIAITFLACSVSKEEKQGVEFLMGNWNARWETTPEAFEGLSGDLAFEMSGSFEFTQDSLTIIAQGFSGCVFGEDTLSHTQGWELSGDTLHLITDQNIRGISYQITKKESDRLKLQLMSDIFVYLSKEQGSI